MSVPASRAGGSAGGQRNGPDGGAGTEASVNGLGSYVAAVESARTQLGSDLDLLSTEVRTQMSATAEKTAWKMVGALSAVVAGFIARRTLMAAWRAAKKHDPPANPASRSTTWGEAISWAVASGVAMAVARLVAMRGAAAGWEKVRGSLPPGLEEVAP